MKKKVLLVGLGNMGYEYAKVLEALDIPYVAVGRGESKAMEFKAKTNHEAFIGGIGTFLSNFNEQFENAIVSVSVDSLFDVTKILIDSNIKNILLEKPGGENSAQIISLAKIAAEKNVNILLAYNRRFYSSVLEAEKIIKGDGGINSFHFEFTEWVHEIETLPHTNETLNNLILANSSHVIDLAFFIGGIPLELSCYRSGGLAWHPSGSVFCGSGVTLKNILFSYQANWDAPGRWSVELCTKLHRLYFKPMESLQIQNFKSVQISPYLFNSDLDVNFKPGLYLQTKSFIESNYNRFCTIQYQAEMVKNVYQKIAGYSL